MKASIASRRLELQLAGAAGELRRRIGLSQREVADRAGCSQSAVSRLERGVFGSLPLRTCLAVLDALGARATVSVTPPFVDRPMRQLDRVHALASAYVRRRLEACGWSVEQEVPIGSPRTIGWIDIMAFDEQSGTLLVQEIKTELPDIGQIQRSLAWYEREAWAAAGRLGWRPLRVVSALLVLASDENEAAVVANRDLFSRWLPLRATELLDRILTRSAAWSPGERGLALIDPRDRRAKWLRPTRLEGRRTALPYVDYRDAAGVGARSSRGVHRSAMNTRATGPDRDDPGIGRARS